MFASVIFLILGYQRADIDITFHITTAGNLTKVSGRDGSGVIYGCRELIDRLNDSEGKLNFPEELKDGPEMVLRGAYVGLQKMTYLPGYGVMNILIPQRGFYPSGFEAGSISGN